MPSLAPTFLASLRAVGTASTMAFAGFSLHRRQFVTPSGKKMLALISQQVTIPAFLFAKIIYCPPDSSSSTSNDDGNIDNDNISEIVCPSVANRIPDLWMLLLWPFYVVFCGLITGYLAAKVTNTPQVQVRSCLAACAFGNSTGLVITLLSVIHKQFSTATELGRIDPTAFLSVYLLLYPVLQWGVGGWLLAPEEKNESGKSIVVNGISMDKDTENNGVIVEGTPLINTDQNTNNNDSADKHHIRRPSHISHILNYESIQLSPSMQAGQEEFGGVPSSSRHAVVIMDKDKNGQKHWHSAGYVDPPSSNALAMMVKELSFVNLDQDIPYLLSQPESEVEGEEPLSMDAEPGESTGIIASRSYDSTTSNNNMTRVLSEQQLATVQEADILPLSETLLRISRKVFQPPVVGALSGLFIASFPTLRGLFENIWGYQGTTAPLHFMFDGIYSVGQAAVPVNMMILGINLSSTFQKKKLKKNDDEAADINMLPNQTMLAIVMGKMIVMPIIGIISVWMLERYGIDIPDEIDATCYLVMMIVFITPTANNVMVMVELSGSSSKEGMARLIGWQYAASPVILSLVLSVVVSLASCHFDKACQKLVDI